MFVFGVAAPGGCQGLRREGATQASTRSNKILAPFGSSTCGDVLSIIKSDVCSK